MKKDALLHLRDTASTYLNSQPGKRKEFLENPFDAYYCDDDWGNGDIVASRRWENYLVDRGFLPQPNSSGSNQDDDDPTLIHKRRAALGYLSQVLTYPLTLAHHWNSLVNRDEDSSVRNKKVTRIMIVGAEMELMVGPLWTELPLLVGEAEVEIFLVGPLVMPLDWTTGKPQSLPMPPDGHLPVMHATFAGKKASVIFANDLLEDMPPDILRDTDAFVAFGPGCGSPNDSYSWRAAFATIIEMGRPLLLTAYLNDTDADNDEEWWTEHFSTAGVSLPEYTPNPWRSVGHDADMGETPCNGYSAVVVPE